MKKIIKKYWGIALILTMLVSMLVSAVPASAGTLTFSTAGAPNPLLSNQILASDVNIVRVAPNGDIFVVDRQANPSVIWKSVNGGQTWTTTTPAIGLVLGANDVIVDLQISPSYTTDSTLFILVEVDGGDTAVPSADDTLIVMQSTNGGASFTQLGGNIGAGGLEQGTSLAVQPTYMSGVGQILVGTSTAGGAGDIYAWGAPALNWVNTVYGTASGGWVAGNVARVVFSPLAPIDSTVMAVQTAAGGTTLAFKVATNNWNTNVATIALGGATNAAIVTADVAFPSDFNASIAAARNLFVGIGASAAGNDNVYRVTQLGGTSMVVTGVADTPANSLAYSGTYAAGMLYVGLAASTTVWYSANPGTPVIGNVIFAPTAKAPTGAAPVSVALSGTDVYAGTVGGAANDESAFNVSYDGGANFYQIGLIDTTISNIQDLALANANMWFMATANTLGLESLWKSMDGGATWLRIHTLATGTNLVGIALSTNFNTDTTMYFYEMGAAGGACLINLSMDGGNTWTPRAYPAATTVGRVIAVDQYVIYVADAGAARVFKSVNNGWTWAPQTVGTATVFQIKLDATSGHILAGTSNGLVYLSTNGATWVQQGAAIPGGANIVVAFDANYGTNGLIYGGDTAATGVFRQAAGASAITPWFNLDNTALTTAIADIFVAPDGTLYATDSGVGGGLAPGGLYRALVPTSGAGVVPMAPTGQLIATGLTGTYVMNTIDYLPGSNIIYVLNIDAAGNKVSTYTDTLSTPMPVVVSPAADAIIISTGINVVIEPVAGATAYQVQWNTRDDWLGTGVTELFLPAPFYSRILGSTTGVAGAKPPAGATIYYRVRVNGPVVGPWSATKTVETQLAPAPAPNAPAIVVPAIPEGSTAQGGFNVDPLASFFWFPVTGATSYEFQLATDAAMTSLVVDATGADALGNVTSYTVSDPLAYNTTYYWRVRAISASSETAWSNVQAFRVMAEPTVAPTTSAPAPTSTTITITTEPAPTITFTQTQPAPTTITIPPAPAAEEVSPAYIWVIIIIGAILVIAVIVLIVRTRRSV